METVTLMLERGGGKNREKLQRFTFILAGLIFIMNLFDYTSSWQNKGEIFKILIFAGYLLGGVTNIGVAFVYDRIKSEAAKDKVTRWLNALTGILLLLDAVQKFALGKIAMPITLSAAGLLYLLVAYYWTKFKNRRVLSINDEYVVFRKWIAKAKKIPVAELRNISLSGNEIKIFRRNGKSYKLYLAKNEESAINMFEQKLDELKMQR